MFPKTLVHGVAIAIAASALGAAPAVADTTVSPDPTAQNVTAYGTTVAWSRKAADGYHLVVAKGTRIEDAPVPASSRPYDPDLGPTKSNGRAMPNTAVVPPIPSASVSTDRIVYVGRARSRRAA